MAQAGTVVFSAPQAWGKTRNATQLRNKFSCRYIVDGWDTTQPLKEGAIHLTNLHPDTLRDRMPACVVLVERGWQGGAA